MRTVHISASPASIGSARTYVPQFDQDTELRHAQTASSFLGCLPRRSGSQQHSFDTFRPEACWLDKHSVHRQKSDRSSMRTSCAHSRSTLSNTCISVAAAAVAAAVAAALLSLPDSADPPLLEAAASVGAAW